MNNQQQLPLAFDAEKAGESFARAWAEHLETFRKLKLFEANKK